MVPRNRPKGVKACFAVCRALKMPIEDPVMRRLLEEDVDWLWDVECYRSILLCRGGLPTRPVRARGLASPASHGA